MDWIENTKISLKELQQTAGTKSVDELVRLLNDHTKLEQRMVQLLLDIQSANQILRNIVVRKKSFSVTG